MFRQNPWVGRLNWRNVQWRLVEGKAGTTFVSFRNHSFCFERNISITKQNFSRLLIFRHPISRQNLRIGRLNCRNFDRQIFEQKQVQQLVFRNYSFRFGRKPKYTEREVQYATSIFHQRWSRVFCESVGIFLSVGFCNFTTWIFLL